MLSFARRQILYPEQHDIDKLLSEMAEMLRGVATSTAIRIRPGAGPAACLVDRVEFELAAVNVAVNAEQAMPAGGSLEIVSDIVHLPTGLSRHRRPDLPPGDYARISFTDTGTGMPPEVAARAFDPFFTTKEVGGTGLGLSQVYGFAHQAGGDVVLTSRVGVGTTVAIYLPVVAVLPPVAVSGGEPVGPAGLHATILVVEDTEEVLEMLAEMLASLGSTVLQASNAEQALTQVRAHRDSLDLLLCDVVMPGAMPGPLLAEEAKKLCPKLKVLMMTGHAGPHVAPAGRAVLRKPFSSDELSAKLRAELARNSVPRWSSK
jgi:CheY-like chemotaxis protein